MTTHTDARHQVSTRTGWHGISVLLLSEKASLTCSKYLSVAADETVEQICPHIQFVAGSLSDNENKQIIHTIYGARLVLKDVTMVMNDLLVGSALVVVHSILHGLVGGHVGRTHRSRHGQRVCQTIT